MIKYNIVYADPPWKYKENWGNGTNEHTYSTLTVDEIKNLKVNRITSADAHLYLWVTNPFIKEGLEICKAWGFEYKTLITWVKQYSNGNPEMGMGYYFRGATEHIIFGVKGKLKIKNKITKNVVFAINPRLHSKKPSIFREMIVKCSGDLPRIELFARSNGSKLEAKTYLGWDLWGKEADNELHFKLKL